MGYHGPYIYINGAGCESCCCHWLINQLILWLFLLYVRHSSRCQRLNCYAFCVVLLE